MYYYNRIFLVVEPQQERYPNYNNQPAIHLSIEDPVNGSFRYPFLSSPLYSIDQKVSNLPNLKRDTAISFFMIPRPFPFFKKVADKFKLKDEIWFSLGLANLVFFDNSPNQEKTKEISKYLNENEGVLASETWIVSNGCIIDSLQNYFNKEDLDSRTLDIHLSEKVTDFISFSISEFILSANRLLSISKIFTPYLYDKHIGFIGPCRGLVTDLSFLHGDFDYDPSYSLILRAQRNSGKDDLSNEEVYNSIDSKEREDLISNISSRLVHINSTLSYVYNQIYSGSFPIFDHIGIIKYHSLLGIGSAVGAIYELLTTLDDVFSQIPFDRLDAENIYKDSQSKLSTYINSIKLPTHHYLENWKTDHNRETIIKTLKLENKDDESLYFNRLSFFSGRLGFREYQLTATSGIQVLVSACTLDWNVINYTHEIIHNHVRIILDEILNPSERKTDRQTWNKYYIDLIKKIILEENKVKDIDYSYIDLIRLIILKYCLDSRFYGSLTEKWDKTKYHNNNSNTNYELPSPAQFDKRITKLYKGISEIFVHIIDFVYVYSKNLEVYLTSLWSSWACTPIVRQDLEQYIIRTLLVISTTIEGKSKYRYKESLKIFKYIINEKFVSNKNNELFRHIEDLLVVEEKSLEHRFTNSLRVADVVNSFFIANLGGLLSKNDRLYSPNADNDEGHFYDLNPNEFKKTSVLSKMAFVFDQLNRTVLSSEKNKMDKIEKQSAWLLLTLSSINE